MPSSYPKSYHFQGLIINRIQDSLSCEENKRFIYLGDGSGDYCPSLRLKEKELEEKILARKDESRDRKIQMGLILLQIGLGVVVPIVTTAATVTMLNKCGQFETGDDPQIWTTLTSRQVISSIAKGLGIKTK